MRDITDCVASLLRSASTPSLPLSHVHVSLVAEVGPGFGYAQLRNELARRSDLFLLLEPRDPLAESAGWGGLSRGEYENALAHAGADGGLRVALAPPPATNGTAAIRVVRDHGDAGYAGGVPDAGVTTINELDASIVQLWGAGSQDPVLRADLAEAISHAEEIRRALACDDERG